MKNLITATSLIGFLTLLSSNAQAGLVPIVPEIDGGMAAIAISLTLGVVALVREHRRRK